MSNKKGRTAQPGNGAKMGIMGNIHLVLTPEDVREILSGKEAIIDLGDHHELCLQIETGPKNRIIELTPWFDPAATEVTVENDFKKDGGDRNSHFLYGDIAFTLVESENSSLGFSVRAEQAKALAKVLLNYAQAWDSCEALKAEQSPA